MAVTNSTIDKLYEEYLTQNSQPKSASTAQSKVLSGMYHQYTDDTRLQKYSEILGKQISDYQQLTHQCCKILFKYHRDHQPLTRDGRMVLLTILSRLSWDRISEQVGRKVTQDTDLTRIDFTRLIRKNPWFNLSEALDNFQNRPQDHVITSNPLWEYGCQDSPATTNGKLSYIKFYDWLMLDYDQDQLSDIRDKLDSYLTDDPSLLFYVYETGRGHHLFLMSELRDHFSHETMKWMYRLGCDVWYILFTYRNGYRIRLSHKRGEPTGKPIYKFIDSWGTGKLDQNCDDYHNIYLKHLDTSEHNQDI